MWAAVLAGDTVGGSLAQLLDLRQPHRVDVSAVRHMVTVELLGAVGHKRLWHSFCSRGGRCLYCALGARPGRDGKQETVGGRAGAVMHSMARCYPAQPSPPDKGPAASQPAVNANVVDEQVGEPNKGPSRRRRPPTLSRHTTHWPSLTPPLAALAIGHYAPSSGRRSSARTEG